MEEYDSWSVDISDENNTEWSASGDYSQYDEVCSRENGDLKKVFLPIVYAIIFVMGIVGNGLVVIVMGYQKKSKTMTDKYRLHLSIADLLFVLTLPFWAVDAASSWYFGGFLCKIVTSIYTINLYSSVLILAFISLDRYLAVVRATNSQKPRRLLAEKVIYVGVWLPAALLTVPDLVFAQVHDEGTRMMCDRAYPTESSYIWMTVFRFQHIFVGLVLPGLVILTCYCIIITKLSQGSKGLQKRRALKTTIILILAFFICWLPYCTAILVDTLTLLNVIQHSCTFQHHMETWIFVTEALAYFHCCLNPILYAFLGVKFKKSAKSALTVNSRGSSLKILSKNKRGGLSSVSTESESSSFQSS
ncbi:C-X-C chemokine receptor type 4 [Acipenser ruthenus]|uniref:C-X-C chemokine receptor type 4 n=1 Tax=Acipenser ruthenus TaxID=7906 RepID=A0A662YTI1_ACIRT|nr:C-X-C chemokine receptor type 4 [Acipenser ruthenus]